MIQQGDKLFCESWNERMWGDGEPIDPSPTIDQAVNGGFPWLEIQCALRSLGATMSQKSSVPQAASFVSWALKRDTA